MRMADMGISGWELWDNCENTQFYYALASDNNTQMAITIPHAGNDYRWLVRIQQDMSVFDKWDNADIELCLDTWHDVVEVINQYSAFIGE
jgi:hypothetical protein